MRCARSFCFSLFLRDRAIDRLVRGAHVEVIPSRGAWLSVQEQETSSFTKYFA